MQGILLPNTYVYEIRQPLIFLAGPDTNAPLWRDAAIDYLFSRADDLVIASPKRELSDIFRPLVLQGDSAHFLRQRTWERHYLDVASRQGAVMFWLPGEQTHTCDKSYGAMTRLELGQWMTRYCYDHSVRFCVGSDDQFSEFHTIRYDLSQDAPNKVIFPTLEQTCDEALRLAGMR